MEFVKDIREFEVPLTKKEVAILLRIPMISLDRLIRAKKISHFKVGTLVRFTVDNLNEYLQDNSCPKENEEKNPNGGEIK